MKIAVASGKGGTGKTTFAVNLACTLAENQNTEVAFFDCDVETPNANLFINAPLASEKAFVKTPAWNREKCIECGKCAELCRYNALANIKGRILVFNEMCHSCGICAHICPTGALVEVDREIGEVCSGRSVERNLAFTQGLLNIGEVLSVKLIEQVKEKINPDAVNIIDAPPGTSCPVVAALDDVDRVVLVTEPTPFGLHDLKLAWQMTRKMGLPAGIVVNRSDGTDSIIADWAEKEGAEIIGRIPFRREFATTYSKGGVLIDSFPELKDLMVEIYARILTLPVPDSFQEPLAPGEIKPPELPFKKANSADYNEITVISGKGGTGKTTVTSAFTRLKENIAIVDCDVDASDMHLLLNPEVVERNEFSGGSVASIDSEKCIECGKCADACRFGAISQTADDKYKIDPMHCEGCGFCALVCPADAVIEAPALNGQWFISSASGEPMVHAALGIAEENSGKLVSTVRSRSAELAKEFKKSAILSDGPPGTGCPVIASLSGTDVVVIVTEPTVSGIHDFRRVMKLAKHFELKSALIINKSDLNAEVCAEMRRDAKEYGCVFLAEIPFDRNVHDSLTKGKIVLDYAPESLASKAIKKAWNNLTGMLN